jgi:nucleotide-binding universal stress UspA family protein
VAHAVLLARTFGSALSLVHVLESQRESTGAFANDAVGWEISRQEARGYLERLEQRLVRDLEHPVEVRLEQGQPAERIVALAQEIDAGLIVMGSRGQGNVPVWNLGSTVQQVLALAPSSVFVAHSSAGGHGAAERHATAPKRILVPLDGSLRTESVLPAAVRLANAHGAELLLIHVVQEPVATALLDGPGDMELAQELAARLESGARRYLVHLEHQLAHEITAVHSLVVRHASERQCLLDVTQRENVDLILLSAHGSACDSARSFGSVTAYLLTHSMVPLLVLQDLAQCERHSLRPLEASTLPPPSPRVLHAMETV